MRRLDHADVVCSVANSQQRSVGTPFDEFDNERFLQRRDSAADDRLAHDGQLQENVGAFFLQGVGQALAI